MYGSIFCSVTRKPRASRSDPIEAAARPLPNDDTTPPVTKMYFVATSASSRHPVSDLCDLHRAVRDASVQTPVPQLGEHLRDCRPARDPECHDLVAGERDERAVEPEVPVEDGACAAVAHEPEPRDRKSTRLNSSHSQISYAVFCLKKKNKQEDEFTAADCEVEL